MTPPSRFTPNSTDADLIRASRTDNEPFCLLYDRYAVRIFRWCAGQAGDVASDLTAEIFTQAWISRDSFRDLAGGSAGPWLFGIARNVLRDSIRGQRAESRARSRLGLPAVRAIRDGSPLRPIPGAPDATLRRLRADCAALDDRLTPRRTAAHTPRTSRMSGL